MSLSAVIFTLLLVINTFKYLNGEYNHHGVYYPDYRCYINEEDYFGSGGMDPNNCYTYTYTNLDEYGPYPYNQYYDPVTYQYHYDYYYAYRYTYMNYCNNTCWQVFLNCFVIRILGSGRPF